MPGRSPTADDVARDHHQPNGSSEATTAAVLGVVTHMLIDVIGPEYLIGLDIDLDTAFDADLELESLEFVGLAERLLAHYGEEVDFVAWLATMELDEIIDLTVGDLVAFIVAAAAHDPGAVGSA
ncbi:MAG: acyl carrier protein [Acidimicrobiales bacterium]